MPFAPLKGTDLYYESHGEGAETIVFAHGAGGNHLSWWNQVPAFRDRYRCITFDHRCFGQSTDRDGRGPGAYVDDLAGLLDHLGVDRAWLVAQSMGGHACMGLTLRDPARVRGLVMADTVLGVRGLVMASLDEATKADLDEMAKRRAATAGPTSSWAVGPTFQQGSPAGTFLYQQISDLNPPRDPQLLTALAASEQPITAAQLAKVTTPMLFIVGDEDAIMPEPMVRAAHRLFPASRMEVVPKAGHSVYFEQPAAFNRLLSSFIGS
jgi:3-oxoadipate enol-lactonase